MIFYNKYKKFRIENNIDLKDVSNRTKIDLKYFSLPKIKDFKITKDYFNRDLSE